MLRDATLRLPIERCPQNDSAARQLLLRVMGNDPPKTTKPGHRRAASDGKVNTTSKEPTKLYATIALHGPVREMRLSDRTEGQHDSWGPNRLLSTDKVIYPNEKTAYHSDCFLAGEEVDDCLS